MLSCCWLNPARNEPQGVLKLDLVWLTRLLLSLRLAEMAEMLGMGACMVGDSNTSRSSMNKTRRRGS